MNVSMHIVGYRWGGVPEITNIRGRLELAASSQMLLARSNPVFLAQKKYGMLSTYPIRKVR